MKFLNFIVHTGPLRKSTDPETRSYDNGMGPRRGRRGTEACGGKDGVAVITRRALAERPHREEGERVYVTQRGEFP
jgi:hypothetical protein